MEANNSTPTQTFAKMMEEYSDAKSTGKANPHGDHNAGYNQKAHLYGETYHAKADLALAKMILARQNLVKFANVDLVDGVYNVIVNPFGPEFDDVETVELDVMEAIPVKPKGLAMYNEAAGNNIAWFCMVVISPIENLFGFKLTDAIAMDLQNKDPKKFCRQVSDLMRAYPHRDIDTYIAYVGHFMEWLALAEQNPITLETVLEGIFDNLKFEFFQNERKKFEEKGILRDKIENANPQYSWKDCSKYCNDEFAKLNFKVEKHTTYLETIRQRAAEARAAKEAKLAALKTPQTLKRKLEDATEDGEGPEKKKVKLENE